jgi:hypothetical protein
LVFTDDPGLEGYQPMIEVQEQRPRHCDREGRTRGGRRGRLDRRQRQRLPTRYLAGDGARTIDSIDTNVARA